MSGLLGTKSGRKPSQFGQGSFNIVLREERLVGIRFHNSFFYKDIREQFTFSANAWAESCLSVKHKSDCVSLKYSNKNTGELHEETS